MSAFSDWNGPGNGSGSLPQIATLEQLLSEIAVLKTYIESTKKGLTDHVENATLTSLHKVLQDNYNTLVGELKTKLIGVDESSGKVLDMINTNKKLVDVEKRLISLKKDTVQEGIDAEETRAIAQEAIIAKSVTDGDKVLDTAIKAVSADIEAFRNKIETTGVLDLAEIKIEAKKIENALHLIVPAIIDAKEIRGKFYPDSIIDYQNMSFVNAAVAPIGNDTVGKSVALLAVMSEEWADNIITEYQAIKPGRAYVKYVNTEAWNAIIDASVTIPKKSEATHVDARGSISVTCAKTLERKTITFGIYRGTTATPAGKTAAGKGYMYIGVEIEELETRYNQTTSWLTQSGLGFYVAGVNVIPMTDEVKTKYAPSGAVHFVTRAVYDDAQGTYFTSLVAGKIHTDVYKDAKGVDVLVTDHEKETLSLGSTDKTTVKQLELFTLNRPVITHKDLSQHEVAYLTDLIQTIFWQRSVCAVYKDIKELEGSKIWVDKDGAIVGPDNPDRLNIVNGFYSIEPINIRGNVAGHVFATDDVVLLYDSGEKQQVADGKINDTLEEGEGEYEAVHITNTRAVVGAVVVDRAGEYGLIKDILEYDKLVVIERIAKEDVHIFAFTKPAYYHYDGTAFIFDAFIPVPTTFDGHVHDVTYQWAGPSVKSRKAKYLFMTQSTVNWTAHHENSIVYPEFRGEAWSTIFLEFEGYRSSQRQDEIDRILQNLGYAQSDYALPYTESIMRHSLPEKPTELVPNPAYIHNRPWTGIGLLDSGDFVSPYFHTGWMVDGGDFTGAIGKAKKPVAPFAVPSDQQYQNTIFRIWRGDYLKMPESMVASAEYGDEERAAVWRNYKFTFRYVYYKKTFNVPVEYELLISDGQEQYIGGVTPVMNRFIPLNHYKVDGKKIMQTLSFTHDDALNVLGFELRSTDFSIAGSAVEVVQNLSISSDKNEEQDCLSIEFVQTDNDIQLTSPRMTNIEYRLRDEILRSVEEDKKQLILIEAERQRILDEIRRAEDAEQALTDLIDAERARILAEIRRAEDAEQVLTDLIDAERARILAEIRRSEDEDAHLTDLIDVERGRILAEITRSVDEDARLDDLIVAETERSIAEDLRLDTALLAEVTRSSNRDEVLTTALEAEVLRSTDNDFRHDAQVIELRTSITEEVTRSTDEDLRLDTALLAEVARSTDEDLRLDTALLAEVTRSTDEDIRIDAAITKEIDDRNIQDGVFGDWITRLELEKQWKLVAGNGVVIDNTDQKNPIISVGPGTVTSVNGMVGDVTLLDKADNTSDIEKPVSNATKAEIARIENTLHGLVVPPFPTGGGVMHQLNYNGDTGTLGWL